MRRIRPAAARWERTTAECERLAEREDTENMEIKGFSTSMFGWNVNYWTQDKEPVWEEIFRECVEAGLDAVEIDAVPEQTETAKALGLAVSGTYVGLALHEPFEALDIDNNVIPAARRLAEAGGTDLIINADPKGGWGEAQPKTEEEFRRQGDNLARIAAAVRPLGLKVSLHNHAADKHNAEGDLRSVIEYASPEVGLCIDTGWAHAAGCDPIDWIRKYPDRVAALHLRNQNGDIPTEDILTGEINMRDLIAALAEIGYTGWLSFELWHREDNNPQRTLTEDTRLSIEGLKRWLAEF
ncbi:sugar phosphate isomerase/epimerase [Paenibacillus alkaliterrae]|nr:sugar phosphate isomerase/epimerase [Paenibacillus alkaliterrae]